MSCLARCQLWYEEPTMTTVSPNTNSLASLFNERAKNIIKNVSKMNQELAKEKFMVQEQDAPGKAGSVQSNSQPRPTTAEPNKTGLDLSEYEGCPLWNGSVESWMWKTHKKQRRNLAAPATRRVWFRDNVLWPWLGGPFWRFGTYQEYRLLFVTFIISANKSTQK